MEYDYDLAQINSGAFKLATYTSSPSPFSSSTQYFTQYSTQFSTPSQPFASTPSTITSNSSSRVSSERPTNKEIVLLNIIIFLLFFMALLTLVLSYNLLRKCSENKKLKKAHHLRKSQASVSKNARKRIYRSEHRESELTYNRVTPFSINGVGINVSSKPSAPLSPVPESNEIIEPPTVGEDRENVENQTRSDHTEYIYVI